MAEGAARPTSRSAKLFLSTLFSSPRGSAYTPRFHGLQLPAPIQLPDLQLHENGLQLPASRSSPHDVHMSAPPRPALLKVTSRCRPTQPSASRSSTADGCHRPPRRRPRRRLCATVANGERLRLRRRVFRGCIGNCGGRLRPSRGRRRDDLQAACVSNAARAAQS